MKETKKSIVNDIMELIKFCEKAGEGFYEYNKILNHYKQALYVHQGLLERSLISKNKMLLDDLRTDLLKYANKDRYTLKNIIEQY